jgi:hypothetical protein
MINTISKLCFKPIDRSSAKDFEEYTLSNFCGDTAFAMFCSWAEYFDYRYVKREKIIIIKGMGINREYGFAIIHRNCNCDAHIEDAVKIVVSYCEANDLKAVFEYVDESDLEAYSAVARSLGREAEVEYDDIYSDYIYETAEYLDMSGSKNKTKRGGYNFLISHYPEMCCVEYEDSLYSDCTAIFEKWCRSHECKNCFYGCERKAFDRFMDIYDKDKQGIYLAYNGDIPTAFCVFEKINPQMICCYFHKNAERIRGLTYWLSKNAIEHYDCKYVNLGEDMGISGIITDKTLLRPCGKVKKYTVSII